MDKPIRAIYIKAPCGENWDNMIGVPSGKFCLNCQKTVIDFSKMSDKEIIEYFSDSGNVCGRFEKIQYRNLNLLLNGHRRPSRITQWGFAALLIGMFPFFRAEASNRPGQEQHSISFKNKLPDMDTTQYRIISGTVKDSIGLLPGTEIKVIGTDIKTQTDSSGYFQLSVPVYADTLSFSFIGFYPKTIPLTADNTYNVQLSENARLELKSFFMGAIVILPTRPFSRLWRRIKTQREN